MLIKILRNSLGMNMIGVMAATSIATFVMSNIMNQTATMHSFNATRSAMQSINDTVSVSAREACAVFYPDGTLANAARTILPTAIPFMGGTLGDYIPNGFAASFIAAPLDGANGAEIANVTLRVVSPAGRTMSSVERYTVNTVGQTVTDTECDQAANAAIVASACQAMGASAYQTADGRELCEFHKPFGNGAGMTYNAKQGMDAYMDALSTGVFNKLLMEIYVSVTNNAVLDMLDALDDAASGVNAIHNGLPGAEAAFNTAINDIRGDVTGGGIVGFKPFVDILFPDHNTKFGIGGSYYQIALLNFGTPPATTPTSIMLNYVDKNLISPHVLTGTETVTAPIMDVGDGAAGTLAVGDAF